jgi:uncharacterized membrane protein
LNRARRIRAAMEDAPVRGSDVFFSLLAYVPVLFLVPLIARRRSRFVLYHARQGLYAFSVFLVLFVVFAGLFGLTTITLRWDEGNVAVKALAVLTVLTVSTYVVTTLWMMVSVLQKKMVMLPVLGEMAGER